MSSAEGILNLKGVKDKLYNEINFSFILNIHSMWLLETETNISLNVAGFCVYHHPPKCCSKKGRVTLIAKRYFVNIHNESGIE